MIIELSENTPPEYEKNFRIFCFKVVNGFAYVTGDQMYVASNDKLRPFINKEAVYHLPSDWWNDVCYDTAEFHLIVLVQPCYNPDNATQPVMRIEKKVGSFVYIKGSELRAAGIDTKHRQLISSKVQGEDLFMVHWFWLKITRAVSF